MSRMIRKQIYIARRQEQLLKRLAKERKTSEAELIREALDREAEGAAIAPSSPDDAAWNDALRFMRGLARRPSSRRPRFRRETLYTERLRRWR